MKTLTYERRHNLSQLHDEILLAVPTLRPVPIPTEELPPGLNSAFRPMMSIEGSEDTIRVSVPDDTDEVAIEKVVKTHTPKAAPVLETKQELKTRLGKAKSIDEVKEILGVVLDRI